MASPAQSGCLMRTIFSLRTRLVHWLLAALVLAAMLVAPAAPGLSGSAMAQARDQPQTLLELFMRRRQRENAEPPRTVQPRRNTPAAKQAPRRATTTKPTRRTAPASAPAAAGGSTEIAQPSGPVEKLVDARKVLVVGDFMAEGLGAGLEDAFAGTANVVVSAQTNGSSGFVRDDYFDWTGQIGGMLDAVNPDILVVMIGSNDRQAMRVDGSTRKVLSDEWKIEYTRRVKAFLAAAQRPNQVIVWTGAPPFRFRSMSADMLVFNEVFRTETEAAGGGAQFVDIWDGFVDAEGGVLTTGADIKGQTVRLRAEDGINMTAAGKRKLAFYVERQIKQILGDSASPLLTTLGPDSLPIMKLPPLQTEADLVRTNPVALLDPDLDGAGTLLGETIGASAPVQPNNPLVAKSVRQRLVEDGVAPPARPGRAGYFASPQVSPLADVSPVAPVPPVGG